MALFRPDIESLAAELQITGLMFEDSDEGDCSKTAHSNFPGVITIPERLSNSRDARSVKGLSDFYS